MLLALPRVIGSEAKVPLATGAYATYANLDYAATAPCLESVRLAVDEALAQYSSVHRGSGYLSQVSSELFEQARAVVHEFAGAGPEHCVIFTRHTTDSMNLMAHALPAGTQVVVFESEHHATLLPWEREGLTVTRLPVPPTPRDAVDSAVSALRFWKGPSLLAVTAASNVTGEVWPVAQLAHAAHAQGARILVDAAQLAPHRPLDMLAWGVDYLAFSGHKLYAPFGAGVLVGLTDWLAAAPPYLRGGGAVERVAAAGVDWATDPRRRHEAGTPNFLGAVALAAACTALADSGWDRIVAHEEALLRRLREGLATLPGVNELTLWGPDFPRIGIVTFTLDGLDSGRLAQDLSDHHGIGVRCGKFCAHLFVHRLLGAASGAAETGCGAGSVGAIRASFGLGTLPEHLDRLIDALADALAAPR